jgi:hypothetical protein
MATGRKETYGRWIAVSVIAILGATISPQPEGFGVVRHDLFPRFRGDLGAWLDVLQNLILYFPLGLVLAVQRLSFARAALAASLLSFFTEIAQLVVPGRDPTAIDIVSNALGAQCGWLVAVGNRDRVTSVIHALGRGLGAASSPDRRLAPKLALGWGVGLAALAVALCWLATPALPAPFFYLVGSPYIDRANGPLRIGSSWRGTPFRGRIDEVRLYNTVRTPEETREDMRRPIADASRDRHLVAAYSFDRGSDTGRDDAGGGLDASLTDVPWTPDGRFGGAIVLNGESSDVVVDAARDMALSPHRTVEAWIFPAGDNRGRAAVVEYAGETFYVHASSERGQRIVRAGGAFGRLEQDAELRDRIPDAEWTHVAASYDGQVLRLYVNGELAAGRLVWSTHRPIAMSLDGAPLSSGGVAMPRDVEATLLRDFRLGLTLQCGEHEQRPAPVFSLTGVGSRDVLTLTAVGQDVWVHWASWAQRLRLPSVGYHVPGALEGCSSDRRIDLVLHGPLHNLRLERDGRSLAGHGSVFAMGWGLVFRPELLPPWLRAVFTGAWIVGLYMPLTFWLRRDMMSGAGLGIGLAAIWLPSPLFGMARPDSIELGLVAAGCVLGVIARIRFAVDGAERVRS